MASVSPPPDISVIRKILYRSPEIQKLEFTEALTNRLQVEHDVEAALLCMQKDLHEERLKQLRQLQTVIAEDDWRYTPAEKLIGLQ